MKCHAITTFDGPDGLRVIDRPDPEPGPGEVLVEVHTVGANRLDLAAMHGRGVAASAGLPLIPGIDPAGRVASISSGVTNACVGDPVVVKPNIACWSCQYCLGGEPWDCSHQTIVGVHRAGGFAPYVVVPATNVVPLPPGVTFTEATAAIHSFPVALRMIKQAGEVRPGQRVLVLGAAGAVGSSAVQLAHTAGATVIGAVSGSRKAQLVATLGASEIIDYMDAPDFARSVLEATAQYGADLVIDTAGVSRLVSGAFAAMAWRGVFVTCGAHGDGQAALDLGRLYRRRQRVIGSASSGYEDVSEVFSLLEQGTLHALVNETVHITEVRKAFLTLENRSNLGKIVLSHF